MEQLSNEQLRFLSLRPYIRKVLRGKEVVTNFAKELGLSGGTMYRYLSGSVPDVANSKLIVEKSQILLNEKGISYPL